MAAYPAAESVHIGSTDTLAIKPLVDRSSRCRGPEDGLFRLGYNSLNEETLSKGCILGDEDGERLAAQETRISRSGEQG